MPEIDRFQLRPIGETRSALIGGEVLQTDTTTDVQMEKIRQTDSDGIEAGPSDIRTRVKNEFSQMIIGFGSNENIDQQRVV